MSSAKVTMLLAGAEQLKRSLKLADPRTRERVARAIERNTKAVRAGAEARAPKKSGEMQSTIRDEYSRDGMVGFVKVGMGKLPRSSRAKSAKRRDKHDAKRRGQMENNRLQLALASNSRQALSVADLGVYAPVVERGDKKTNRQKHPFMVPSLQQQKPAAIADIDRALNQSMNEVQGA